ncbi:Transcription factor HES-4-B [Portunus trituberculatus]|uniref:Transcription factor HES-4-B n=1 Tax=Portunus trituberculatus TaxID=210409 RepID=A0A5B7GST8_PORTR|nr:Transcription factor HES-4-B [Portunus trituberculatus]
MPSSTTDKQDGSLHLLLWLDIPEITSVAHLLPQTYDTFPRQPSRYSKLEKADILEMTVRHVQALHRHEAAAPRQPPVDAAAKFRAGFGQCAAEVGKFLESDTTLSNVQRSRILLHLTEVMTGLRNKSSLDTVAPLTPEPQRVPQAAPYDSLMVGGVPLVPARLLNGQMTFVLPNDITTSFPSHGGELHRAPPSPPPSAASPSLSLVSSSPPPSPSRSPSPQPLDLAPVRHPEDDNCWRPCTGALQGQVVSPRSQPPAPWTPENGQKLSQASFQRPQRATPDPPGNVRSAASPPDFVQSFPIPASTPTTHHPRRYYSTNKTRENHFKAEFSYVKRENYRVLLCKLMIILDSVILLGLVPPVI